MQSQKTELQFLSLSNEIICYIFRFLPLQTVLVMSTLCRRLCDMAHMHFQLCKSIDLAEDNITGHMTRNVTEQQLKQFLKHCPNVETIYGLTPRVVVRNRGKNRLIISMQAVVNALKQFSHLKAVETSDPLVAETILHKLPHIKIIGHFRNQDRQFMPKGDSKMKMPADPNLTSFHVSEIDLENLPPMPKMEHLYLEAVRFKQDEPFEEFHAPNLHTCIVRYCTGMQTRNLRYLSFLGALSGARNLTRLEFVGLSNLGISLRLFSQHVLPSGGFRQLRSLAIGDCKDVTDTEIGYLVLAASQTINTIKLQPSLCTDRFFVALKYSQAAFSNMDSLHLGFVDDNPIQNFEDSSGVLTEITDAGIKVIGEIFQNLTNLCIENCPYLQDPSTWIFEGEQSLKQLQELRLSHCGFIHVSSFALFLSYLSNIKVVILKNIFHETFNSCESLDLSNMSSMNNASQDVGREANRAQQSDSERDRNLSSSERERLSLDASEVEQDGFKQNMDLASPEPGPSGIIHDNDITRKMHCGKSVLPGSKSEDTSFPDNQSPSPREPQEHEENYLSLRVVSETLISLTLTSCGLSHVIIVRAPSLVHLEVIACSRFQQFQLQECSVLKKLSVASCPKLIVANLVAEVLSLPPTVRLIFIEPADEVLYDCDEMERLVFSSLNSKEYLYLLHDFSPKTLDCRARCRETFLELILLLQTVHSKVSFAGSMQSVHTPGTSYPWGKLAILKLCGKLPHGCYELIADNPVIGDVWLKAGSGLPNSLSAELEQHIPALKNLIMMAIDFKDGHDTGVGHTAFYVHVIEGNKTKIS